MRAVVVGIGRFAAAGAGEMPVGARAWADLPFVDEVVPPVVAALNRLGYATDVHKDIGAGALRAAIGTALGSARLMYVAAHGDVATANPHRVDVVPADGCVGVGTNAAQWVDDAQTLGVPTLFLFDLCRAGRAASLPHMVHGSDTPANAWVIAASGGGEDAYDGRFSIALAEVFEEVARTGLDTDPARTHVPFSKVARRVRQRVERMPGMVQTVQSTAMVLAEEEPDLPFFPHPGHDPKAVRLGGVEPALRMFLDPSDALHFTDKAGLRFTGRRSQLRVLAPWLDDVTTGGLRVVTGNPGIGKSALLGALACAAHPELVAVAGHVRERLDARDAAGCPSVNDRLAAMHARGRTSAQVFASAARQLHVDPGPDALVDATVFIGLLPVAGEVPVLIVDALDEASDPAGLCADLARLAQAARADGTRAVRLLVGTRPWPMFDALLDRAAETGGLMDLDAADPDEVREDLADHLGARLADTRTYGPPRMRAVRQRLARAIADRLSPRSVRGTEWGAFLVAEIFTRHLAQVGAPEDLDAADALGRSAPGTLPEVLERDLALRPEGPAIHAVLSALALAQGEGMPLEVALPLAGLFADVDAERARALLPDALFYLRATPDHDGTLLYRLFHQALVDHLTGQPTTDTTAPTRGDVLDHLLATHTTHDGNTRAWDTAPPYLLRYALAHAESADRLDELLTDTEYLVHGDPSALTEAFPRAATHEALVARAVYRASIGTHRYTDPATRRRLLTTDAARHPAALLVRAFTDMTEPGVWTAVAVTGGIPNLELRDTMRGHDGVVIAVACTTLDGKPIAVTGAEDETVRVWDLSTGTPLGEPLTGHDEAVMAVACTTLDGKPVAVTGAEDGTVRVWDLSTGTPLGEPLTGHDEAVMAVACTTLDGKPIAISASADETVRVWDLTTGTPRGEPLTGHDDTVTAVACTTLHGKPVAVTGTDDGTVRVWDMDTGTPLGKPLTGHDHSVYEVACTTLDGKPIAISASADETVRVWDLTTGTPRGEPLTGHDEAVMAVACTTLDGKPVAVTGAEDGTVRVWDLATGTPRGKPLTGHDDTVTAVACTTLHGKPVAVTGAADSTVRVWDLTTGTPLAEPLTGHDDTVTAVACTTLDGKPVAVTGADDGTVRVWDMDTGTPLCEPLTGHTGPVHAVACAVLDGKPVAVTGAEDGTVRVWDLATFAPLGEPLAVDDQAVYAVAYTTLDEIPVAVAGYEDGIVGIWDLSTGTPLAALIGHTGLVYAVVCATLDGKPVAITGAADGTVRVWDMNTSSPLGEPLTHRVDMVTAVACAVLDGRPVAVTGAEDGIVVLWDLSTGTPLAEHPTEHAGPIYAVACTTLDGKPVAVTRSDDEIVGVWDLTTGECMDRIFTPDVCRAFDWGPDGHLCVAFEREIALLRHKRHHTNERPVHADTADHRTTPTRRTPDS
ncbi:AAA family ATPase [Embleya sp. NPDC059259]|uniref:AAA family ATPase n=3 Tax=Embleya TaxID=2699295 RepID=UPI0036B79FE2